ncbi:OmpA family protein [Williamwhitmania taraxaci]|uniref:OmpA family protein n=1 Tax=Williamwhitmania taraxaci TaxID=1640674 RepID=A0A1G6MNJ8_9BACT|nr:OmpA family protein [Williamwhitmania taraxaci]SDC57099.1 OmpA family protein [Williamwhitmania taraxaci]
MIKNVISLLTISFISASSLFAQTILSSPGLYQDSLGRVFIQEKLPSYFFVDTAGGTKLLLPGDKKYANPMYFDGAGSHFFVYTNPANGEKYKMKIMADGAGPKSSLHFSEGLSVRYKNKFYCEKGARAVITAKDDKSGVSSVYVSNDGIAFSPVSNLFTFDKEGEQKLRMYAIDNVGNVGDTTEAIVVVNLEATINMPDIFFDYNSSQLRESSFIELLNIVELLKEHQVVRLEIVAHTDCRGSAEYNLKLSAKRALSVLRFMESKGIAGSRLRSKGMGSKTPVNRCTKGVTCSEEEHQANRRVEFKLLPLK